MKNWKKKDFDTSGHKGSPFGKKIKNVQNFFSLKNHTFSFWICIVNVVSFLLRYITFKYSNFSNLDLFVLKDLIFLLLQPDWIKPLCIKWFFWCLWRAEDKKKWDASQFWAVGHLLTASKWLELIRCHNGPAPTVGYKFVMCFKE